MNIWAFCYVHFKYDGSSSPFIPVPSFLSTDFSEVIKEQCLTHGKFSKRVRYCGAGGGECSHYCCYFADGYLSYVF